MKINLIKKYIRSKWKYFSVALILILIFAYSSSNNGGKSEVTTTSVVLGNVVQTVSITGKVKPSQNADLSFEKTGKISKIFVNVGNKVSAGQEIMSLQNSDVLASLSQANAQLQIDQARLAEIVRGARKEDLEIKQAELLKSKNDLENYYNDIKNTSEVAYIKADDAVRIKTAGIFSGYKTTAYQFTYVTCAYNAEAEAENLRLQTETILDNWKSEIDNLKNETSKTNLENHLNQVTGKLDTVLTLLQKINDTLVTGCTVNDSSLGTYRTNVSTARANVIAASQDITGLIQAIKSQKITIQKIQSELDLKLAGSSVEEIRAQEAQVSFSRARVEAAQAELSKTIIRAPFNGVVSRLDAKIGESAPVNTPVVSMLSDGAYEIEAYLPEADYTKVNSGNLARVTLDAFGSDVVFEASVAFIDPGETILEGVPTYKTVFHFTKGDDRIKSGMTANVDIETARRDDVVTVPQRSVISKDGSKFVRVMKDGVVSEVEVRTGIKGSKGDIEILSGVSVGDQIVQF